MAIYEKPVKLLFREMIKELSVKKNDIINRENVTSWFKQKYPLIKKSTIDCHLLRLSTNAPSRIHYNLNLKGEDDLLYQIDRQKFRLFDSEKDPSPIYSKTKKEQNEEELPEDSTVASSQKQNEFAYEKDLQNFLSKNLELIEAGLKLYRDEDIRGIEFPVGSRFIDILAIDKDNNYVVIELKVSRGYDRVVGQILRYIAWIKKNHAEESQKVKGIIIAREISEDLILACSETKGIELFEYNLSISLDKINVNV